MALTTKDKNIEDFLGSIKTETKEHGIKLKLTTGRYVKCNGVHCNGYFDDKTESLIVATACENWLDVLVHEYSHFEQWKQGAFKNLDTYPLDYWIAGKDYESRFIKRLIVKVRDLEHDCEKKAVKNIQKFKLPINARIYSKKANAYVHFYNWMAMRRRWYKIGREPTEYLRY